ncbi:hypothetical protein Pelo_12328 [Pelomyxa schiedti]|nr:hypothetical protein Pelo_12328 [Pelomyxa schiedti]
MMLDANAMMGGSASAVSIALAAATSGSRGGDMSHNIFGYLKKQSPNGMRWCKRYFSGKDGYLCYYATEQAKIPKGAIDMRVVVRISEITTVDTKTFALETKDRKFLLQATDTEERDVWLALLKAWKASIEEAHIAKLKRREEKYAQRKALNKDSTEFDVDHRMLPTSLFVKSQPMQSPPHEPTSSSLSTSSSTALSTSSTSSPSTPAIPSGPFDINPHLPNLNNKMRLELTWKTLQRHPDKLEKCLQWLAAFPELGATLRELTDTLEHPAAPWTLAAYIDNTQYTWPPSSSSAPSSSSTPSSSS